MTRRPAPSSPDGAGSPASKKPVAPAPARPAPSASLGLADRGIWSDLDDQLQLPAPAARPDQVTARLDAAHQVLVVEVDGWPVKAYPLGATGAQAVNGATPGPTPGATPDVAPNAATDVLQLGERTLRLRPGDRAELAGLLTADRLRDEPPRRDPSRPPAGDRDDDGIPDTLDVLIGAKKTVLNADAYTGGYVRIAYPMGDVPRDIGVCTDVIVRAVRNAGVDLQRDLHEDIARAPKSYPMVRGRGDTNIDHRRVKTLLPLFLRKWQRHTIALDDPADPLRPGDIVLMDTFPGRSGPDHIGIVSDRLGPSGLPLIINNWTDGTVTAEMDLLTFVPLTHRFRLAPR